MKTAPFPFLATHACLDVPGKDCLYRVNLSCDKIPDDAICDEGYEIMRQLGEAMNRAVDEYEASQKKGNCHEHGSGCTCNSREQPESPD